MQRWLLISAAAFLALIACGCAGEKAKGFPVYVADAPIGHCPTDSDDNRLVVSALGNHRFAINEDRNLNSTSLVASIKDQLSRRIVKVLFLRGEPGASYSDFVEMTDAIYHPDVNLVLVTDRVHELEWKGDCMTLPYFERNRKPTRLPGAPIPPALE